MKKIIGILLAIIMIVGIMPTNLQTVYAAETQTTIAFSHAGAQDNSTRYLIYFTLSDAATAELTNRFWNNNTIYVDGVAKSGTGVNYTIISGQLALCLQYAVLEDGVSSAASMGKHVVMIPAGTMLGGSAGNLTTTNDLCLYIDGSSVTEKTPVRLSLVSALNQPGNSRYLLYLNVDGTTVTDRFWNGNIVYINGEAKTGTGVNYAMASDSQILLCLTYNQFGASTSDEISDAVLEIRSGTLLGNDCVISNSLSFDVNGANVTAAVPKEVVTLTDRATDGATTGGGFYFVTDPIDSYPSDSTWGTNTFFSTGGVYIDGTLESTVFLKKILDNLYYVCLLDAGKSVSANQVVTIDGSIKNNDVEVVFTKTSFVFTGSEWNVCDNPTDDEEEEVRTFAVSTVSAQDSNTRYLIYFDTGEELPSNANECWNNNVVYIDGVEQTGSGVNYTIISNKLVLCLQYTRLEEGVTTAEDLGAHTILIKEGTLIGDYVVPHDLAICTNQWSGSQMVCGELSLGSGSAAQDALARYVIYLDTPGCTAKSATRVNVKIDDVEATLDLPELGGGYAILVPYSALGNATTATEMGKHTIQIPRGTVIGDFYNMNDYAIVIDGSVIGETTYVPNTVQVTLEGNTLVISGNGMLRANMVESALTDKTAVTNIRVEAGVTAITSGTFEGFTSLEEVYYANTLTSVANDAFVGCAENVVLRCVKDREYTGGLVNARIHPYYSFKCLTIGSSYGEDTNTYIYKLAKNYYANLTGREAGDSAYDEIVVAELFTGGGTLAQRVQAINGSPNTSCYYEKWDKNGIQIPTTPTGLLSAENMKMATQDEYWDIIILMQSADDSQRASSFTASTSKNGEADIDVVIDFIKGCNHNDVNTKYYWLQTWSYNYKLNDTNYQNAVSVEESMRLGIVNSMETVVKERVDAGVLDGIIPAGAGLENLKASSLHVEDPAFDYTYKPADGYLYNNGVYSSLLAIQRDTAHASVGIGRFTLGLTAFSYLADLSDTQIRLLSERCYPKNVEEYEISDKLKGEQAGTGGYLGEDVTKTIGAPLAAQAAVEGIIAPGTKADMTHVGVIGNANGDGERNLKDLLRYKKIMSGTANSESGMTTDLNEDGTTDEKDIMLLTELLFS